MDKNANIKFCKSFYLCNQGVAIGRSLEVRTLHFSEYCIHNKNNTENSGNLR
jgi:hypothetical protein